MAGMLYDSEAAAQLEQAYATTDMIAQREELRRSLRASAGESILDLGSGPGFLACELAREVGASGRIVAVDISSDMNSIASKRIAAAGLGDRVDILEGDATALAFADAVFTPLSRRRSWSTSPSRTPRSSNSSVCCDPADDW
jgi:arsenite methyltransferase